MFLSASENVDFPTVVLEKHVYFYGWLVNSIAVAIGTTSVTVTAASAYDVR